MLFGCSVQWKSGRGVDFWAVRLRLRRSFGRLVLVSTLLVALVLRFSFAFIF